MSTRHLLLGSIMFVGLAQTSVDGQTDLAARIDAIVAAPIKAGTVAGVSVAVVKGGATVLMKGYGLADLELNVPTPPGATYEIGSVTKQFTAAAILLLNEQGRGEEQIDNNSAFFLLGLVIEKVSGMSYERFVQ